MISMQIRMEFVVHVSLRARLLSLWFTNCTEVYDLMIIKSDDVQNIGEHLLVGKPSRELKVQLTENQFHPV